MSFAPEQSIIHEEMTVMLIDGNLDTKPWFGEVQTKGKYVQVDLGGMVSVKSVAVVISDGEGDFFGMVICSSPMMVKLGKPSIPSIIPATRR
ncbi:hypothetical protein P4H66_26555 [Paenibacillus dokdonensis]|uniref:Uncharacterized protein n=1 Tax=Paenibacillus dokdonensis TaxID=2567944 RepID=A0ABU6GUJ9_9BACL|nr:hypothetical protein [Paenibacillus dokdonensis]MEC0243381.1 hypothetical protein [Paenibacillus dokdonensis]